MKRTFERLLNWLRGKTTAQKHRQLRVDGLQKTAKERRRRRAQR